MNNIAIIPARGGSKRIPRKNIKEFCGKPMISWSINIAKNSGLFKEVIVSSDDEEIIELAKKDGASAPFKRPSSISDDFSTTHDVISHAVDYLDQSSYQFDFACCIYACAPFIQIQDLHEGLNVIKQNDNFYSYPITEYPHPISRALEVSSDNKIKLLEGDNEQRRTQDCSLAYHDAGQFYWGSKDTWLSVHKIHSNAFGIPIPSWRAVDIDSPEDWKRAEITFNTLNLHE
jgi:N-acylneuraminate cytidylyltransferase